MLYKKLRLSIILLSVSALTGLRAQQSFNAGGGNATGSGGTISFSVGGFAYHNHTSPGGSVAEGVQQPFIVTIIDGVDEAAEMELSVSAFPNPVSEYLILSTAHYKLQGLSYQLFDVDGKLLEHKKPEGAQSIILMHNYPAAVYFLKVVDGKKEIKTFKIIKK
ncbi:MAG: T9SS type A sorting domain-containing protein [Bacteroidales bacterium]|nr:T9SS type A sorting domain-containing protein [Bacteroidales bacterium]